MRYIKSYYDIDDYNEIVKYLFELCVKNNFFDINRLQFNTIFNNSINNICHEIIDKNIKSDKKLFYIIRDEFLKLVESDDILNNEFKRHNIILSFKSDDYFNDYITFKTINDSFFMLRCDI